MDDDAANVLAGAERKVAAFVEELIGDELVVEWSEAATALYAEQYALKQNPYGEAWPPRPGDETRKVPGWKFGKVAGKDAESFSLFTARPNAKRSCVPFEPRGLGRWAPKFQEILTRRASTLAGGMK